MPRPTVRESDTAFPCTSAAIQPKTDAFACGAAEWVTSQMKAIRQDLVLQVGQPRLLGLLLCALPMAAADGCCRWLLSRRLSRARSLVLIVLILRPLCCRTSRTHSPQSVTRPTHGEPLSPDTLCSCSRCVLCPAAPRLPPACSRLPPRRSSSAFACACPLCCCV